MCVITAGNTCKKPLVSVGILTYNRPNGLRRTLECITGQTYKNLEIVVSNNCSPESETDDVVREFMARDSRIQYYRQDENKGQTFNFKFVFEKATGEYFMWAADDDEWESSFVDTLLPDLVNYSDISVVMCGIKRVDENGNLFDIIRFPELTDFNYHQFKFSLFVASHTEISYYIYGLYRSKCLKLFYQNLDNSFASDHKVISELLMTTKFHYIDQPLYINQCYLVLGDTASRYPNEEIGKNYADPFNYLKFFLSFGPYLYRSKNIPVDHKVWIPFLVIRQGIWVCGIYKNKTIGKLLVLARNNAISNFLLIKIKSVLKH
jgi:glycosyltransferase involved in cell wall biosynthesis